MDQPGDLSWSPGEEMMGETSEEKPSKEPQHESHADFNTSDKLNVPKPADVLIYHVPWGDARKYRVPGGKLHQNTSSRQKALNAAAKETGCEDLKLWKPTTINLLYWTAASTPNGDPDVMEAQWESVVNHVQDIHEHGNAALPRCAHPPLEGEASNKEWLEPVYAFSPSGVSDKGLHQITPSTTGEQC